jgi:uracil-DNA glycosylase
MNKIEAYKSLVEAQKRCSRCNDLSNPATIENGKYDSNQIGPWSRWQADLNAHFLVVGQDWGDVSYFLKWGGRDQPSGNPTNENLQALLENIEIKIGKPCESQNQIIFFTNLILCLKKGGLQARVKDDWFNNCTQNFFKPLVEIIEPRAILALGQNVSESILNLYDIAYRKDRKLSELMEESPYQLTSSMVLFPLYHCGAGGVNRNRSLDIQKNDWAIIKEWKDNTFR